MSSKERVRYGRVNTTTSERVPKNTLLTFRDGNLVHFGIARCHSELDCFKKDTGKLIAKNRACLAASEAGVGGIPGKQLKASDVEGLIVHRSGMRGTVKVEDVKTLLQYFRNIDTSMLPERLQTEVINAEAV